LTGKSIWELIKKNPTAGLYEEKASGKIPVPVETEAEDNSPTGQQATGKNIFFHCGAIYFFWLNRAELSPLAFSWQQFWLERRWYSVCCSPAKNSHRLERRAERILYFPAALYMQKTFVLENEIY
jgi:hypothetical protein